MDGYALHGDHPPATVLPVHGRVAAGDPPGATLPAGGALRIMTGAPVPAGADRVLPFEHTDRGLERVAIHEPVEAGANVRRRAEVLARGDELLAAGSRLTAEALALLAGHGYASLPVHRAPRVAVLPTGDEVVPPEEEPGPGQLRDTHTDFLVAACAALGVAAEPLGIAPDAADELRRLVERGLAAADVLLLGGGVSAGELDLVEGTLAELGCEALFTSLAVQPGKPLVAAVRAASADPHGRRRLIFGLPGNPGSVMVTFHLVVRPALRRLLGDVEAHPHDRLLAGVLSAAAPGAKSRQRYVPARVQTADGRLEVTPLSPRGSHDMSAHARADALLFLPPNAAPAAAGEPCRVLLLG
jgi:molybdopterin molybdotransferase